MTSVYVAVRTRQIVRNYNILRSLHRRDRFHLDHQPLDRQRRHADQRRGRRLAVPEQFRARLAHRGIVRLLVVDDVSIGLDYIRRGGSCSRQRGFQIPGRLPNLGLQVARAHQLAFLVNRHLARNEYQLRRARDRHDMRIAARRQQGIGVDILFFHVFSPGMMLKNSAQLFDFVSPYCSTCTFSTVISPEPIISSSTGMNASIFAWLSTISTTIGRSSDSRRIFAECRWLDLPKPIGPRSRVALPSCSSRAFSTIASYSGLPPERSLSPIKILSNTASRGICIA